MADIDHDQLRILVGEPINIVNNVADGLPICSLPAKPIVRGSEMFTSPLPRRLVGALGSQGGSDVEPAGAELKLTEDRLGLGDGVAFGAKTTGVAHAPRTGVMRARETDLVH